MNDFAYNLFQYIMREEYGILNGAVLLSPHNARILCISYVLQLDDAKAVARHGHSKDKLLELIE